MKLVKMLSLAVIVFALALASASSASANATTIVLCENAELVCETPFPNPTTTVGHAVNSEVKTSLGTVVCKKSLAELTLLNELSSLVVAHVLSLSFEECALGKTACTVTVTQLGLVSYTKTGALTANAQSTGGTKANVHCGLLINCNYGGEPTLKVHSSATGETKLLATESTVLAEEGEKFVCPDTSKWVATYTALGTMWLES
ncbi:MAG TPA: hypothetical protein VF245_02345 [Solirubrobacterales bacterium]